MITAPHCGWRAARAGLFAAVAVALGAVSHLAAGGPVPAPPALALLAFPVALVALVLTSAPRGRCVLPVTLAVIQVYLHHGFLLLSAGSAMSPHCAGTASGPAVHSHSLHGAPLPLDCGAGPAAAGPPARAADGAMLLMHLAATVVTAWALTHGEAWLGHVLERALRGPTLTAGVVVPVRRPAAPAPPRRRAPRFVVIGGGVGRRGPPPALPVH